jgi:hypothetical protein
MKLGDVIAGANPCNKTPNPGTRSMVSLLAQSAWVLKSIHFEGGSPFFRGQFQPREKGTKTAKAELAGCG